MPTLDVSKNAILEQAGKARRNGVPLLALCACLLSVLAAGRAGAQDKADDTPPVKAAAQDAPAAPELPVIKFRERPRYPADPQRMRRTPQIDGVLGEDEWDPFYTIADGPIKGTVYCNWDDNYLYVAVRTDQPATILLDLDMGGDGWLRGADNLEIVVGSLTEGASPTVVTRLLDAANSKDTPVWNETAVAPKSLLVAGKLQGGTQFVEIAIPKSAASLVLRPGATIGLRCELLPPGPASAYVPTQPFEPHLLLDATLVDSKAQAVAGVTPRLTISDNKCVAGQTLFATFELANQTDQRIPIKSILWTGKGSSANALNTVREVSVPPLPMLKAVKRGYKTILPNDLPTGSYTLTVTAEMEGGRQVVSSASFAVVEPLQVQMASVPDPVVIIGLTKMKVNVDVFSAVPDQMRASVELAGVPGGWELEGSRRRGVTTYRQDTHAIAGYTFKLPSTTPAGDYPIEATVTWRSREWKTRTVVHVARTDAAKPAPTKP